MRAAGHRADPGDQFPETAPLPRRAVTGPTEQAGEPSPWPAADAEWFHLDTRPLPEEHARSPLVV
ncbi:hypothetical protein [Streptomyces sp. NPDC092370]|uniref:hypothetical protein n=1 Tax=Streptomyces sp. NPDC092370 TaxID=3366016 RepID=UPI0037F83D9A